ncbi:Hpt domain-containing protein [Sunxiuqinia sp. A32]|uniref:Hpt domain-containing protein n=1 Tax=Sunxiuqinia sp. A32 TaxID=3461496 RepID=UPI0040462B54
MSEEKYTSLEYLSEIAGGESEIIKEFIVMFFDQLPEFREGLRDHLNNKRWKELGELAHKAKSSVLTFGMNEMGVKLKELQLKTQQNEDIESYEQYVEEFEKVMDIAEKELQEELDKIG